MSAEKRIAVLVNVSYAIAALARAGGDVKGVCCVHVVPSQVQVSLLTGQGLAQELDVAPPKSTLHRPAALGHLGTVLVYIQAQIASSLRPPLGVHGYGAGQRDTYGFALTAHPTHSRGQ